MVCALIKSFINKHILKHFIHLSFSTSNTKPPSWWAAEYTWQCILQTHHHRDFRKNKKWQQNYIIYLANNNNNKKLQPKNSLVCIPDSGDSQKKITWGDVFMVIIEKYILYNFLRSLFVADLEGREANKKSWRLRKVCVIKLTGLLTKQSQTQ